MKGASWLLLLLLALSPVAAQEDCDECRRDQRPDHAGDRSMEADGFEGRWVAFERDGPTLHNLRVDGVAVLETLTTRATFEEVDRRGNRVELRGDDTRLILSDSRTGHIDYEGDEELELVFVPGTTLTPQGEAWRVQGPGFQGLLTGDLRVNGTAAHGDELAFHIQPRSERAPQPAQVEQAIESRRVAGEVRISDEADVLVYDDVNITVDNQPNAVRVVFDAELEAGRTFVVDVDPARFTGPDLELRYFDVHDQGETEVVFRQATNLDDILNPDDDGGQPEYWVVRDADGLQVLVSVPHWSVHAITIQSVSTFLAQPSVLLGLAAGIGGVGVAALLLLRRD